jgi:hypothetical protein
MSESHTDPQPRTPGAPSDQPIDGPVRYPTNSVVGVLDTEDRLDGAVRSLTAGGFLESELHVAAGEAAADAMRASTGRTGLAGLATRIAARLGVENAAMESKAHDEEAMREGRYVLVVAAPTDDRKERAAALLGAAGAHAVRFHGRFTIEGVVPPNES